MSHQQQLRSFLVDVLFFGACFIVGAVAISIVFAVVMFFV